ncbi:helix-turn-helix transcriptional regulator [Persicobacter psychrovividus]|uniref:HTH araC/xylS-type domain-containing protein n=1 Tax=Persicobacter psychrovividus TaxID=387638 RepID=A0ABM7VJF9_9BACT|nr:hypothetical protein PEPS_33960 [Persicobacter psychrovividus]
MNEFLQHIGGFQCVLGALAFCFKKEKSVSDYLAGLFLAVLGIGVALDLYLNNGQSEVQVFIPNWFIFFPFMIGPIFYLYSSYLLHGYQAFHLKDLWHFIMPLLIGLGMGIADIQPVFLKNLFFANDGFLWLRVATLLCLIGSFTLYGVRVYRELIRHNSQLDDDFSYISDHLTLNWVKVLMVIFFMTYLLPPIIGITIQLMKINTTGKISPVFILSLISNIGVVLFAYGFSYFSLKQKLIFAHFKQVEGGGKFAIIPQETTADEENTKEDLTQDKQAERHLNMDQQKVQEQLEALNHHMSTKKLYLNPELTVAQLAHVVNISKLDLTDLLNKHLRKNFYNYVNEYRIAEVKMLLADPKYQHMTILALAFDSGFRSKSSFNSIFKQYTGQTPSAYRNQALSQDLKRVDG